MTEGHAGGGEERYPEAQSAAEQWQRVILNRAVDARLAELDLAGMSAAEISGDMHAGRGWRSYESLDYPAFDLCSPVERPGAFDMVICEQVLEHVIDPFGAARNLRELCVSGGHVIVSTPFLIRVHELPLFAMRDYWRFTPSGLRTLLEQAGLAVEQVGEWGNRECVMHELDHWTAFRPWHSLEGEPDIPVQVWAFARRHD
jgi:SAM-dependent methyltransferase